ncbi:Lrp/AsnC family transcriptional regulator [Pseudolysinimonas kribbensis]|jgi:DNA-binding Lrp family transcriptional regulator|uniref:Transcriptional regulator n=1 Tax=Pseudolysinimonas kribbensis TaxID=433641 RepID=A0ABQ6K4W0_9MICO|nr:Lrp/AsnC family transcriptional regulator [Pseudolysinimonas kribbensis]GMA94593.1 transcriptional regulator [Pseudolysinimonas kribbensis]
MQLDETDRQIMAELRRDGRAAMSVVAQAVHISRANAYARVNRMIEAGVITGFGVRIDPVRAGQHSSAYVELSIRQESWQQVREQLLRIDAVAHIALIGGEFDVILLVRARDNRELRRVVLEELQAIPEVRTTRTSLIFEDLEPLDEAAVSAR